MKSKTVLVTGGAGSIGSHVVDRLIARGDRVIVVDDFNDFYDPQIKRANADVYKNHKNYVLYEADIRDPKVFGEIFKKRSVDVVVHLAARAGVRPSLCDPELYWSVNVMGTLNLLEEMRKANVPQLVFASSSSVYGQRKGGAFSETDNTDKQISPYGASKKAKEVLTATYAHLYGIKTTGLRFFTAYGPRNRPDMACYLFADAISSGEPINVFGDGSTKRDYTYIGDIADGVVAAIDHPQEYELINLGNSKPVMLSKLIGTIEKEMGKKAMTVHESERPGDVALTFADTNKAKKLLGWEAKIGIEEGIAELVKWYRQINDLNRVPTFGLFEKILVGLICLFAFLVLSININEPFWGHHEFNGVFYGQIARNYLQYGLVETKGAQVNNLWPSDQGLWNLHTHHPATYPLLLAVVYSVFGISESAARMLSIVGSTAGVGALMYVSWKNFGRNALLSVMSIIMTPLFLYYGRLPVFEPLLMPLVIMGLFAYIEIEVNKKWVWILASSVFGAFLLDWPGFWLGFWIFVAELFTKRRKNVLMCVAVSMLTALLLIVAHQWIVTGHPYRDFLDVGRVRLAGSAQPYNTTEWVKLLLSRTKAFYGLPVLILAVVGFVTTMFKGSRWQKNLLVLSLAIGISHILVFRNITWYHDYMLYHLIPFFVFALGGITVWFEKNTIKNIYVMCVWLILTLMTVWTTNKFYVDLSNLEPHRKCVEIGLEVGKNYGVQTFELNEEDARICPPFTGYYGNKEFKIEVE